jgi:uncharacterized protein
MPPFTLLIKPSGSDCNIDCAYCFYKGRDASVGTGRQRMSNEVLETLVRDYMRLDFPVVGFAWQGGEPTLAGLDFFKKAVELEQKYGFSGQSVGGPTTNAPTPSTPRPSLGPSSVKSTARAPSPSSTASRMRGWSA